MTVKRNHDEIHFEFGKIKFEMNLRQLCSALITIFLGAALVIIALKAGCEYQGKKIKVDVPGQTIEIPHKAKS